MRSIFVLLMTAVSLYLHAGTIEVQPDRAVIIQAQNADAVQLIAAQELQKHFELITGKKIEILKGGTPPAGYYPFYIGRIDEKEKLKPEEAVWRADQNGCRFYGDDNAGRLSSGKSGTLTAVYDFLEKNFGVRWIEPGDRGIVYRPAKTLRFEEGEGRWGPDKLVKRQMRPMNPWKFYQQNLEKVPPKFRLTQAEFDRQYQDLNLWLKRQRMGGSLTLSYGHAFVDWYTRYSKEHPDWFAMHEDGTRVLRGDKVYGAKLCVSNPEVAKQVVSEWAKTKGPCINTCENDGGFFCNCPECLKLDVRLPGEKLEDHLTDRYLNFTNRILALAQKQRPDVVAVMYAYGYYRFPPRRERVMPNTILGFVPSMLELEMAEKMYRGWHQAGAEKMFLRPNDQHVNTGLPMGFEKSMFDAFQLGIKHGIIGTDYDCIHGFWPATGIADYILARAHIDPSKPFDYWEDEYCTSFGTAKDLIRSYYRYWRENVWEKRLLPNRTKIGELGRYGNFRRGLMWYLDQYYRISDFDATDRILEKASQCSLSPQERERLDGLRLANRHARLTFLAATAKGSEKYAAGSRLYQFRLENRDKLNFEWARQFGIEQEFGDVTGANAAAAYAEFDAFQPLPVRWRFQIDPKDVGTGEKWELSEKGYIQSVWDPISVDRPWERQTLKEMHPALKKQLENYDGIGWYGLVFKVDPKWKGSKVCLYFGGVDESAWVWVNGKKAGERLYKNADDWKRSFTIRIDGQIDWTNPEQVLVIRVQDTGGQGGIWKPVALVKQ